VLFVLSLLIHFTDKFDSTMHTTRRMMTKSLHLYGRIGLLCYSTPVLGARVSPVSRSTATGNALTQPANACQQQRCNMHTSVYASTRSASSLSNNTVQSMDSMFTKPLYISTAVSERVSLNSLYDTVVSRRFLSSSTDNKTTKSADTEHPNKTGAEQNVDTDQDEKQEFFDDDSAGGEHELREAILAEALKHVDELGWTTDSIAAGATALGQSPAAHGMFQRGAADLIDYFMVQCNKDLLLKLHESREFMQEYVLVC
jgi:Ubiquinone biosynthesis protein COQ9, N-terminal domain